MPNTHRCEAKWKSMSKCSASLVAQMVKHLPAVQQTWVRSLGWEDPLEKEMATHSNILSWKIPWTEEPGSLQSMGVTKSQTWLSDFTFTFHFHWSVWFTLRRVWESTTSFAEWASWGRGKIVCYLFSCVWLFAAPWTIYSPQGSSVCGILQARILEWIAILFFRGSSQPRDETWVSHTAGRFFTV